MSISVELIGVDDLKAKFAWVDDITKKKLVAVVNHYSLQIQNDAKLLTPVDMGLLRSSIKMTYRENGLVAEIGSATEYAIFIEFGTGPLGRAGHPNRGPLPPGYQPGTGGGGPPIQLIVEWLKRKGIKPKNGSSEADYRSLAYFISKKIGKIGQYARPFLFPAYEKNRQPFLDDVKGVMKAIK